MTPSELSAIRVECALAIGMHEHADNPESFYVNRFGIRFPETYKCAICGRIRGSLINDTLKFRSPNYPEDTNAALTLAQALTDEGWTCSAWSTAGGSWNVVFGRGAQSETAAAPTFELALCQAFLAVHRRKKA